MIPDQDYTLADHDFRAADPYAAAKYDLTEAWLRGRRAPGAVLFHVGCGSGVFNATASAMGFDVTAFEPDPDVVPVARRLAPPGCEVVQSGLGDIPGSQVAEVIVMHDVLEHIADDAQAVEDLHRLLRSDGVLVLSVPAMPSLFGYHDEQLGHYRRYTRRSLRAVLSPRFEIVRLRSFGASFIPLTWVVSRRLRRPYPTSPVARRDTLTSRAFRAVCALERRVSLGIGTSLVVEARPRR